MLGGAQSITEPWPKWFLIITTKQQLSMIYYLHVSVTFSKSFKVISWTSLPSNLCCDMSHFWNLNLDICGIVSEQIHGLFVCKPCQSLCIKEANMSSETFQLSKEPLRITNKSCLWKYGLFARHFPIFRRTYSNAMNSAIVFKYQTLSCWKK